MLLNISSPLDLQKMLNILEKIYHPKYFGKHKLVINKVTDNENELKTENLITNNPKNPYNILRFACMLSCL